jgi:DUF438 domain-containing protein
VRFLVPKEENPENLSEPAVKEFIVRAESADGEELKEIRKEFTGNLEDDQDGDFLDSVTKLLEGEISVKDQDDPRGTFKNIFTVGLSELRGLMEGKEFSLPDNHPILGLFEEHRRDLEKLQELKKDFEGGNDGLVASLKGFYKKLDTHILKEEESLFPRLEEKGLSKIPITLRGEHEKIREQLVTYFELLQGGDSAKARRARDEFEEEFLPAISCHIFRETFVFYPAALKYIQEDSEWTMIERGFGAVDNLVD